MVKDIKSFIKETFLYDEEIQNDASLLENGVMDSTGALELALFLEEKFGITVEDDEMVPENLDSIDNIIKFVKGKL